MHWVHPSRFRGIAALAFTPMAAAGIESSVYIAISPPGNHLLDSLKSLMKWGLGDLKSDMGRDRSEILSREHFVDIEQDDDFLSGHTVADHLESFISPGDLSVFPARVTKLTRAIRLAGNGGWRRKPVDADDRLGGVRRGRWRRDEPITDALVGPFVVAVVDRLGDAAPPLAMASSGWTPEVNRDRDRATTRHTGPSSRPPVPVCHW